MPDSTGVCTGQCCAVFPLAGLHIAERMTVRSAEADRIMAMVEPLTRDEALARYGRLGLSADGAPFMAEGFEGALFTCRHWDESTRLCTAYEDRPLMCSAYPYQGKCTMCDFEIPAPEAEPEVWAWSEERQGWLPTAEGGWYWDEGAGCLRRREGLPAAGPGG